MRSEKMRGNQNAKKPEDKKALKQLQIRCTQAEKDKWKGRAKEEGKSLSEWTRGVLNDAVK